VPHWGMTDVPSDRPLTWDDVEVDTSGPLYAMRQEQDRLFGTPSPRADRERHEKGDQLD
jgi:hypothetical protein